HPASVDDGEIQQPFATTFIGSDRDPADRKTASGEGVPKLSSQAADAPMASTARACRSDITTSGHPHSICSNLNGSDHHQIWKSSHGSPRRPAPKPGRNPSDQPRSSRPHHPPIDHLHHQQVQIYGRTLDPYKSGRRSVPLVLRPAAPSCIFKPSSVRSTGPSAPIKALSQPKIQFGLKPNEQQHRIRQGSSPNQIQIAQLEFDQPSLSSYTIRSAMAKSTTAASPDRRPRSTAI
ncbi:hypothetical protein ACLOJK_039193, partial [Asimina triloba]